MTAALSAIEALLADVDPEARRRGTQLIADVRGPSAVRLLETALGDGDWRVRKEAAAVAPTVEPRPEVVASLFRLLGDRENVGLRNASVEALVLIGNEAVPGAIDALERLDADGRKLVVEVLGGIPDLAGTRALARALDDEDVNVRAAAAEALGSAGRAGPEAQRLAVAALTDALTADEPLRKLGALASLTRLQASLPWSIFEPLTNDPLLRRHAIAAAGRTHETAAVAALARATADPSLAVARDALVALVDCLAADSHGDDLGRVARHELRRLPLAIERIRSLATSVEESRVRGAALVALGLLRVTSDVPELVRGLSDEDVSERAELGLRWFGKDAVSALLEEGTRSSAPVRAATLSLVPLLTERADVSTLEVLREALSADAPQVRTAALQALAITGNGDDLAFLAPHTTSADARIAATASAALTTLAARHAVDARTMTEAIPPDSPVAVVGCILRGATAGALASSEGAAATDGRESADVAFLRAALDHGDFRVRRAAVEALASIGGPTAADVIARALADEEREVVLAAVRALGRTGHAEPLGALLEGGHDPSVVAATLRAMGEANPSRAFDAAWGLLRSDDPLLASSAVETIGQLRGARRDEGLFLALDHSDPGVVKTALVELSRDMTPSILARVGLCLDDASFEVRRFAAELLGGTRDAAALALIRSRLDRESDPVVREALSLALASEGAT